MTKIDESSCEGLISEDEMEKERLRLLEEEQKGIDKDELAYQNKQLHLMEQDAIKGEIDNMLKSIVDSKENKLSEEKESKKDSASNKTSQSRRSSVVMKIAK